MLIKSFESLRPDRRDNDTINSLRNPKLFSIRAHTNKYQNFFLPYAVNNFM